MHVHNLLLCKHVCVCRLPSKITWNVICQVAEWPHTAPFSDRARSPGRPKSQYVQQSLGCMVLLAFLSHPNLREIIHLMDFKMKWWSAKEVISDPLLSSSIEHSQRSISRPGKNNKPSATCAAADGPTSVDSCPGWFASLWAEQKDWVSQLLPKSQATWQIAVTHFPCGHEQGFYKSLANMGLDLLVTGHRHDQELWLPDDYAKNHMGITCIVTGGGGGITSEATPDPDHTEADHSGFWDRHGSDMIHFAWFCNSRSPNLFYLFFWKWKLQKSSSSESEYQGQQRNCRKRTGMARANMVSMISRSAKRRSLSNLWTMTVSRCECCHRMLTCQYNFHMLSKICYLCVEHLHRCRSFWVRWVVLESIMGET